MTTANPTLEFVPLPNILFEKIDQITGNGVKIYALLQKKAMLFDKLTFSFDTLSKELGLDEKTVRTHVHKLVTEGMVVLNEITQANGIRFFYQFILPHSPAAVNNFRDHAPPSATTILSEKNLASTGKITEREIPKEVKHDVQNQTVGENARSVKFTERRETEAEKEVNKNQQVTENPRSVNFTEEYNTVGNIYINTNTEDDAAFKKQLILSLLKDNDHTATCAIAIQMQLVVILSPCSEVVIRRIINSITARTKNVIGFCRWAANNPEKINDPAQHFASKPQVSSTKPTSEPAPQTVVKPEPQVEPQAQASNLAKLKKMLSGALGGSAQAVDSAPQKPAMLRKLFEQGVNQPQDDLKLVSDSEPRMQKLMAVVGVLFKNQPNYSAALNACLKSNRIRFVEKADQVVLMVGYEPLVTALKNVAPEIRKRIGFDLVEFEG